MRRDHYEKELELSNAKLKLVLKYEYIVLIYVIAEEITRIPKWFEVVFINAARARGNSFKQYPLFAIRPPYYSYNLLLIRTCHLNILNTASQRGKI